MVGLCKLGVQNTPTPMGFKLITKIQQGGNIFHLSKIFVPMNKIPTYNRSAPPPPTRVAAPVEISATKKFVQPVVDFRGRIFDKYPSGRLLFVVVNWNKTIVFERL